MTRLLYLDRVPEFEASKPQKSCIYQWSKDEKSQKLDVKLLPAKGTSNKESVCRTEKLSSIPKLFDS